MRTQCRETIVLCDRVRLHCERDAGHLTHHSHKIGDPEGTASTVCEIRWEIQTNKHWQDWAGKRKKSDSR